jgi:hypothetical protein
MTRTRTLPVLVLLAAFAPALAVAQPTAAPAGSANGETCEAKMQALEQSPAEGEERLAEKNEIIAVCAREYRRDAAIARLVKDCAKYEKQAVAQQQFVAECQLAAYNYANALRAAKSEFKN